MIKFLKNIIKRLFFGKTRFCPVCQSDVTKFVPLPKKFKGKVIIHGREYLTYQETEMLNAKEYTCPNCGASDRERFYALYLKEKLFKMYDTFNMRIVHFAPEGSLKKFLNNYSFKEYRTSDLIMDDVDDKADLTNLYMYKDNYFDFFICSHILEHVYDDRKAMQELYRILKSKSKGILVVPILEGLDKIYEDSNIVMEKDRLLHFGQEDHIRMYNKAGYLKRLRDIGFSVTEYSVEDFSEDLFTQAGITYKSILYVVEK